MPGSFKSFGESNVALQLDFEPKTLEYGGVYLLEYPLRLEHTHSARVANTFRTSVKRYRVTTKHMVLMRFSDCLDVWMSDCLDTWISGDYLSGRLIVWRSDVCVPDCPDVWAAWISGCLGV